MNGRKRHLPTDTLGLLLTVLVTPASTTHRDAARTLLPAAKHHFRRLARVWADGGYTGHLADWTAQHLEVLLDIVRRGDDASGFRSCPAAGSSRDPSPGSCAASVWSGTTSGAPTPVGRSSCGR
ncbi:transposase [Streptomyces olivaceoviridis]|uniref:transposase n=1 Tax=Streptomyces olivaceoviridis TaxID=1921 RepID=UPI0036F97910